MLCSVYYGEISEQWEDNWFDNKDDNPFTVLKNRRKIECGGMDFFSIADKYLFDQTAVDWGSWAWKATKKNLEELQQALRCQIEGLEALEEDKLYGVVFVEEYL